MKNEAIINVWFTVDDLHHLQRGGRVSKTTAIVGSMINIKPPSSYNGIRRTEIRRHCPRAEEGAENTCHQHGKVAGSGTITENDRKVAILHGDCMEDALAVKKMVNDLGF